MNKTNIEWTDYTWNPITGCLNGCEYCYARKLANGRLRERYLHGGEFSTSLSYHDRYPGCVLDPFYPRFWPERVREMCLHIGLGERKRIFVCDMGELFGDWIPEEWQVQIFNAIKMNPQHTFQLLTKQPQNLAKWEFPSNCWVGMTVTGDGVGNASTGAIPCFEDVEAKVKFVSFEPLLSQIDFSCYTDFVDWAIIGLQTPYSPKTAPKIEWVAEIVEACNKADIPYFLKDNLKPLALPMSAEYFSAIPWDESQRGMEELRQDFPC